MLSLDSPDLFLTRFFLGLPVLRDLLDHNWFVRIRKMALDSAAKSQRLEELKNYFFCEVRSPIMMIFHGACDPVCVCEPMLLTKELEALASHARSNPKALGWRSQGNRAMASGCSTLVALSSHFRQIQLGRCIPAPLPQPNMQFSGGQDFMPQHD